MLQLVLIGLGALALLGRKPAAAAKTPAKPPPVPGGLDAGALVKDAGLVAGALTSPGGAAALSSAGAALTSAGTALGIGGTGTAGGVGAVTGAAGIAAGAGLAAGAAAEVALGAYIGSQISHNVAGTILAGAGPAGLGVVVGTSLGNSFDAALGGGSGAGAVSSVVAQLGATVVLEALAYGGFAVAGVALAAVVPIYAAARLLTAAFGDLAAQAYGQNGAMNDYRLHWQSTESSARAAFAAGLHALLVNGTLPDGTAIPTSRLDVMRKIVSDERAIRMWSEPYADGYMHKTNRLVYREIMRRPRGIGIVGDAAGNAYHCRFFRDRGAFCGDCSDRGELVGEPAYYANLPYYSPAIAAGEQAANIAAYIDWMKPGNLGAFQNWTQHCTYGLETGRFDGVAEQSNTDGVLIFAGHRWLFSRPDSPDLGVAGANAGLALSVPVPTSVVVL